MRASLLAVVCLSSAFTCRSDALDRERPLEAHISAELGAIDMRAGPQYPDHTPSTVTTTRPSTEVRRHSPTGQQTHYALAKHLERAEQWRDDARLFNFGEPGDAKYTFGGWLGHPTSRESHGGQNTLRLRANNIKLALPADRADLSQLTISARSFGPARLAVHVNGHNAGAIELTGERLEKRSCQLKPGVVKRGDNLVELRLYAQGAASEPGFALDYAALTVKQPLADVPGPVEYTVLRPDPLRERLILPANLTLAYTFEVPEHASFDVAARSDSPAQLRVRVVRDAAPTRVLASIETRADIRASTVDLSELAGEVVRLELRAEQAAVWLERPIIAANSGEAPLREPPAIRNVILYLVDTLRADKLAPYNPRTRVRTPALARFVQDAAVATAARSQENWTKPSVATLLSSLLPWEHNTFSDTAVLPCNVQVLPQYLQQRGYFTGGFIANGYISEKFGFNRGFNTYRNYIREGRPSSAQYLAADALRWLDARPRDKPFFLYVHTSDAHVPYQPPRSFLELYDNLPYSGPIDFVKRSGLLDQIKLGRLPVTARDKQRLAALYDGAISYHDAYFGALMTGLDKRDLAGDTLVVVTADHGEEFWDHGSVGHGHSLYDELLRVPLLVRAPGLTRAGDRIDSSIGLIDVAPTILEALGQLPPETMSGRSFFPELMGASADAPRVSVAGFMTGARSLAVGRYKLIQNGFSESVLYDTRLNPHEHLDSANDKPLALAYARSLLGLALARGTTASPTASAHPPQRTLIDADTERPLRALGDTGSSRH